MHKKTDCQRQPLHSLFLRRKRCTIIGIDNSERVHEYQRGKSAQARSMIKNAHFIQCRKRCTIIGIDNSERVHERQRSKGAQALRKKNAGHKALLVLDKQIKINMCRTKERRQQNEC